MSTATEQPAAVDNGNPQRRYIDQNEVGLGYYWADVGELDRGKTRRTVVIVTGRGRFQSISDAEGRFLSASFVGFIVRIPDAEALLRLEAR